MSNGVAAVLVLIVLAVIAFAVWSQMQAANRRARPTSVGGLFGEGVGDIVSGAFGIAGMGTS